MSDNHVHVKRDGDIGTVAIDRSDAFNALNSRVLEEIAAGLVALSASGVRVIVITGAGEKAFSAGADLIELDGLGPDEAARALSAGQRLFSAIEASEVPVIAAVNGLALGGGFELALSCTFILMAERATLGLPESGLGLIPGYGGTQRLPAIIGRGAAAYAMLSGDRINAARAFQLGLTPLPPVPLAEFPELVRGVAEKIASKGPAAIAAILRALGTSAASRAGLDVEAGLAAIAIAGRESGEGIAAFREKRQPGFAPVKPEGVIRA